jgi:hypothetical protein
MMQILLGIWAAWIAMRIARKVIASKIVSSQPDTQIKPNSATLELMACPKCGVYTSAPCTNSECPK